MSHDRFLVDTSALGRLIRFTPALAGWNESLEAGLVEICPVTEIELLYGARSLSHRHSILEKLGELLVWVPLPDRVYGRATEVQEVLTSKGQHRSAGVVDLLVAATAELTGRTLVHYDRDFETIAKATGQPTQWLAKPGSIA